MLKENLINYNYINNIELENELSNKDQVIQHEKIDYDDYNALDYNKKFIDTAKIAKLDDNTVDSNYVLYASNIGKRFKRMHDAKNSLTKLDWDKYFYTELKDNENSIWWEDQVDLRNPMSY